MTTSIVRRVVRGHVVAVSAALLALAQSASAFAKAPEIRTHPANPVPTCVTPARLMAFLTSRNGRLDPRFKDIATHYKTYGEAWRVRWDYAFFQMAIETNFLTYRQPNGRMGDVDPKQNNFAGIGTTGGGVPGNSFPDVKTGVHAQIQHLVVYSGERLAAPIAERTQLKQNEILEKSIQLDRPVLFGDLARRWAVDPNYDKSIEWVADLYRKRYCDGRQAEAPAQEAPPAEVAVAPEPRLAAASKPATRAGHPAVRTIWVRSEPGKPLPVAAATTTPTQGQASAPKLVVANQSQDQAKTEGAMVPTATKSQPAPASDTAPVHAAAPDATPAARPAFDPAKTPPAGLGAGALGCSIGTASYGGTKTVLIKAPDGDKVRYTALTVLAGFERSLTDGYIKARAQGGAAIGEYADRAAALEHAKTLCPASQDAAQ